MYGGPYRFTVNAIKECEYYYKGKRLVTQEELPDERTESDMSIDEGSGNVYDESESDDTSPEIKSWMNDIKNGRR